MAQHENPTRRVGIYARVSTLEQTTENQLLDLRRFCIDRGWQIVEEFVDHGISGTQTSRPALDRLLDAARKHHINTLLVWRLDRLGRSVKHLILTLDELREIGVQFVSFGENLDSTSPLGRAIFGILAVLAEMERSVLIERVKAGINRARSQGKRIGRPPANVDVERVRKLQAAGVSVRGIASQLGVPKTTVGRVLKRLSA